MRGTVRDWNAIKVYYGLETIKREALAARYFDAKTLSFCSVYFNILKTEFRCFTGRQLTRKHWNY